MKGPRSLTRFPVHLSSCACTKATGVPSSCRGAAPQTRVQAVEIAILKLASAYFAPGELAPKMTYPSVQELAKDGLPVAVTCRVLEVSRSRFYEWASRGLAARC